MNQNRIAFHSDNPRLEDGFRWAQSQALHYAHDQSSIGPWYEAALPGRDAFCMRDVSHQAAGAHFLGLDAHTKNMLLQFAKGISESRDWCSYWEITGLGTPAPVDYTSDRDFWYNLPANFDVLDACWRMYCLTGDRDYLENPAFVNFYDRTVTDYVSRWDHDGDGIPDRAALHSRRGIPSYDEQKGMEQMAVGADLIAAQYRGYLSYAKLRGRPEYAEKARRLALLLSTDWWDSKNNQFYGAMDSGGRMLDSLGSPHLLAYFDAVADTKQRSALLNQIQRMGENGIIVELASHYPEIFFRHGQPQRGLFWLYHLIDPRLERREYPEVSFAAIGAYVTGLFGLSAAEGTITLTPWLPEDTGYMSLTDCPLFGGTVDLLHNADETLLQNNTSRPLSWQGQRIAPGASYSQKHKASKKE